MSRFDSLKKKKWVNRFRFKESTGRQNNISWMVDFKWMIENLFFFSMLQNISRNCEIVVQCKVWQLKHGERKAALNRTLYPRALSSLVEQGYRSMNLYLSTNRAVSLPSYSSLKARKRLRSTFSILARSPMLLSNARKRAQISLSITNMLRIDKMYTLIWHVLAIKLWYPGHSEVGNFIWLGR